jgi:hypothetical protein
LRAELLGKRLLRDAERERVSEWVGGGQWAARVAADEMKKAEEEGVLSEGRGCGRSVAAEERARKLGESVDVADRVGGGQRSEVERGEATDGKSELENKDERPVARKGVTLAASSAILNHHHHHHHH